MKSKHTIAVREYTCVLVRSTEAGLWYGRPRFDEDCPGYITLLDARRICSWQVLPNKGITLSSVALYGADPEHTDIAESVPQVWMKASEVLWMTEEAIANLDAIPNAELTEIEDDY